MFQPKNFPAHNSNFKQWVMMSILPWAWLGWWSWKPCWQLLCCDPTAFRRKNSRDRPSQTGIMWRCTGASIEPNSSEQVISGDLVCGGYHSNWYKGFTLILTRELISYRWPWVAGHKWLYCSRLFSIFTSQMDATFVGSDGNWWYSIVYKVKKYFIGKVKETVKRHEDMLVGCHPSLPSFLLRHKSSLSWDDALWFPAWPARLLVLCTPCYT